MDVTCAQQIANTVQQPVSRERTREKGEFKKKKKKKKTKDKFYCCHLLLILLD